MKHLIFYIFDKFLKIVLFLRYPNKFSTAFSETLDLVYVVEGRGKTIKIASPNRINFYRAETFFTKEPDMIEWLETINQEKILLDIGANIGLYSIYGGLSGIKKIIAIEPESQNYGLLNKNIYENQLSDKIIALNIGFSDHNGIEDLYIPKFNPGAALNNLGENLDWKKEQFTVDFRQSVLCYTLDSFLETYPDLFPTHIKIDVDGIERKIIDGAKNTLKDKRLKEIIIELNQNLKEDMEIVDILVESGFVEKSKRNSPTANSAYDVLYNHLFIRV